MISISKIFDDLDIRLPSFPPLSDEKEFFEKTL